MSSSFKILFNVFEWFQLSWRRHREAVVRHPARFCQRHNYPIFWRLWVNNSHLRKVIASKFLHLPYHCWIILIEQSPRTGSVGNLWQVEVCYWRFNSLLELLHVLWTLGILVHHSYNFVVIWFIWKSARLLSPLFRAQHISLCTTPKPFFPDKAREFLSILPIFSFNTSHQRILHLAKWSNTRPALNFKFKVANIRRRINNSCWQQPWLLVGDRLTI